MTGPLNIQAAAVLEGLSEVALLLAEDGTILHANRAASVLLGPGLAGTPVFALHDGEPGGLATYVDRCRGSRQPLVGTITLRSEGKYQCRGNVIGDGVIGNGAGRAVLLRLSRSDDAQFALLTRNLEALRDEVRARQRTEAILRESISERELLLRELQHRVNNNMQMLSGILSGAEREAESEEARAILGDTASRFAAIGAVQQLLYASNNFNSIDLVAFVETLARAASSLAADPLVVETDVEPLQLPIGKAPSLALILNELLTNAVKYGMPARGTQKITVTLKVTGGMLELRVGDNGPGFGAASSAGGGRKRASGLGLVRGLLRQLGGSLAIEADAGARCVVRISHAQED
ncbi:two-component sensor histidine kinase [Polymorphobacter multimanifer]|uniref:histidine kinase n=1 Tax=Polymorphobacter multimanifer TaxID=1070431 RepID=A0A841L8T8_9SPHN|nr:sensor histidine kinase [Polymorphobacter multimanifer]MBB6227383.1 two-component sensor histidine kinase [Polymorphobacter multimanifer]